MRLPMYAKWVIYTFLGWIADGLDIVLTYVMPDTRPERSIAVSTFSFCTVL